MKRTRFPLAVLSVAVVAIGGCGSRTAGPSRANITIAGYAFMPGGLTVARGARVTFVNRDATAHTATATVGGFDTGSLRSGQSATVTLRRPGSFTYYCQFHAFMRATLTVK